MIRTMWLALFCLGGISTVAVVRFVTSASVSVVTIGQNASASFEPTVVSNAQNETLTKADRLPVNLPLASPETTPGVPIEIVSANPSFPPAADDNIVSRHWHDSSAPVRSSNFASTHKVKNITTKSKTVSARPTEVKCSEDSSRTLLHTLNLSPKCRSALTLPVKRTATAK